ncbi:hypothetical protein Tco_1388991 [Tanacetum coccineum]
MLHMESYLGAEGEWKYGLAKESKQQDEQLNSLRSKFAAKIILDHSENIEETPIANNGECEIIEAANITSKE